MTRQIVLCDLWGTPQGTCELREAHRPPGRLHLAFSVFVFRHEGREVLLQQRAAGKPLFALRWANTCCSHPRPGDTQIAAAAQQRLQEECGFTVPLTSCGSFVYYAPDEQRGVEYEYDTVLCGKVESQVQVASDPREIHAWRWAACEEVDRELVEHPDRFAPWFVQAWRIASRS